MKKKFDEIVRRTISLPRELHDRMSAHNTTNWSEVARLAFERHLQNGAPDPIQDLIRRVGELEKARKAEQPR